MEAERDRLEVLLAYLLEHSREHEEGFQELAQRMERAGQSAVRDEIMHGVDLMSKANKAFEGAMRRLKQGGQGA